MITFNMIVTYSAAVVGLVAIFWLWDKWATKRLFNQIMHDAHNSSTHDARSGPKCTVVVTEDGVTCARPDGTVESVRWNALERVAILANDDGPFGPDMFWLLHGIHDGCVIPWGSTGETELMKRLQSLPDFRNDVIINAVSLSANNQVLCWSRRDGIA